MSTYKFDRTARYVVYRRMIGHDAVIWSSHRSWSAALRSATTLATGRRTRPDTAAVFIQDRSLGIVYRKLDCNGHEVVATGNWTRVEASAFNRLSA